MKKSASLTALASLAMASTAMAQHDPALDHLIDLGDITLEEGDVLSFDVEVDLIQVVGMSFYGNAVEIGGGAWASDTILTIDDGAGNSHFLGGFPEPGPPHDWDFQGADSSDPTQYFHGIGGEAHGGDGEMDTELAGFATDGTWTLSFEQDWGNIEWNDVSVTIHQVPVPGAFVLLGLAGLVGTRRRHD